MVALGLGVMLLDRVAEPAPAPAAV